MCSSPAQGAARLLFRRCFLTSKTEGGMMPRMQAPEISVIIPVYKAEACLRRCLDSLLAQDCPDWEAVCVDDGSPDGSGALLDSYAAKDSRFVVCHQENAGVSAARNAGIRLARGQYLTFMDADDWYAPEALRTYRAALQQGGDIACSAHFHQCPDGHEIVAYHLLPPGTHPVHRQSLAFVPYCVWGKAFRREIIVSHDLTFPPGMKLGEDMLFLYKYLVHCRRLTLVPTPLYHYSYSENSALQYGARGGYSPDVYDRNLRGPLEASDYMQTVISQKSLRREFNLYFLWFALREHSAWKRNTAMPKEQHRELMRRNWGYILELAKRSASSAALSMLAHHTARSWWHKVRDSLR